MGGGDRILESNFVKKALQYMNDCSHVKFKKTKPNNANNAGEPDLTGCVAGIRVEIECKVPGKDATPLQKHCLAQWKEAGAITGIAHDFKELHDILVNGLRERGIDYDFSGLLELHAKETRKKG